MIRGVQKILKDPETMPETDSGYAQIMRDVARLITNPHVVRKLSRGTVASAVPLRVLEIEYFKVK